MSDSPNPILNEQPTLAEVFRASHARFERTDQVISDLKNDYQALRDDYKRIYELLLVGSELEPALRQRVKDLEQNLEARLAAVDQTDGHLSDLQKEIEGFRTFMEVVERRLQAEDTNREAEEALKKGRWETFFRKLIEIFTIAVVAGLITLFGLGKILPLEILD